MKPFKNSIYSLALGALLAFGGTPLGVANAATSYQGDPVVARQAIIKLDVKALGDLTDFEALSSLAITKHEALGPETAHTYLVTLDPFKTLTSHLNSFATNPLIDYAEPNYVYELESNSSDPNYLSGELWGMGGSATTPTSSYGANAAGAWANGYTGSKAVYVAVIDSGIDVSHPDLAANVWVNAQETAGNGIDDDGNGFIDDINGYDFLNNDGSVFDTGEHPHGTHVAGTIGAVGGNGVGVTGVSWNTNLISAKVVNGQGQVSIANAIRGIDYITMLRSKKGLDIIASNNSWGGEAYSRALEEAVKRAGDVGIIFVASAGNDGRDITNSPTYPAAYDCTTTHRLFDCVVSVASMTSTGVLSGFSNFSATRVDIAAPGSDVLSTLPNGQYGLLSGTSMAAPHVTGALALCLAAYRGVSAERAISKLLSTAAATSSLSGKVASGGRLDVSAFVSSCASDTTALSGALTEGRASAIYTNRMRLDWEDTAIGDYEQEIQVSVGPSGCTGSFQHLAFIGPGLVALPINNLDESQFYCFRVRAIRDSVTTAWEVSNVAITWTSNLPFIYGKVLSADGVTPVANAPVKWLAVGQNATSTTPVAYTNISGEYVLQVSNGVQGELYVETTRFANRAERTNPITPWGLIAGGKLTVNQDTVVDVVLPHQNIVTLKIKDALTNQPVAGARIDFPALAVYCNSGSYTAFTNAAESRCSFWPAGTSGSGPSTNSNGEVQLAFLDSRYFRSNTYVLSARDPQNLTRTTTITLTPATGSSTVEVSLNPPVTISGKVLMADGVTPIAGAPVRWLTDGVSAGSDYANAIKTTSNAQGEYSLLVPEGAVGKLLVATTRNATGPNPATPPLPWGLDAGGKMTASESKTVDLVMPKQHRVTFKVVDEATGAGVPGARFGFGVLAMYCRAGTYTAFTGATDSNCNFWPAGTSSQGPRANSNGELTLPFFTADYFTSSQYKYLMSVTNPANTSMVTTVEIKPTSDMTVTVTMSSAVTLSGKVFMSDGTTAVQNASVKWQAAGAGSTIALSTRTNTSGEYSLKVPSGVEGRLFVDTPRTTAYAPVTTPQLPWGLDAGGNLTATADRVVDIVLPKQNNVTFNVTEWASSEAVSGARFAFTQLAVYCQAGTYTAFTGATNSTCNFWPAGTSGSGPTTNNQGQLTLPILDGRYFRSNSYFFSIVHPLDSARVITTSVSPTVDVSVNAVMPGTPSKPEQPKATALTNEVKLNWTEPWNGGAFIDYYKVWVSLNADGPFALVDKGSCAGNIAPDLRSCVVTGLTPGVTYYFAIIAHNVVGYSQLSMSVASVPLAAIGTISSSPIPTVSGTALIGETLRAVTGTWDSGITFEYKWLSDGSAIAGAVSSEYVLRARDAGKKISVEVTGRKTGFTSVTKASNQLTPAWPTGAKLVGISGKAAVGQILRAELSPLVETTGLGYSWLRDGVAISGATSDFYEPTEQDAGAKLSLQISSTTLATAPAASVLAEVEIAATLANAASSSANVLLGVKPIAISAPGTMTKAVQKVMSTFTGTKTTLSVSQKQLIAKVVKDNPSATKLICTGIYLAGSSTAQNLLMRKRAKAACDYAKSLDQDLKVWYQSKSTKTRSSAGKTLITAS